MSPKIPNRPRSVSSTGKTTVLSGESMGIRCWTLIGSLMIGLGLTTPVAFGQDILVDNFDDNNALSETWSGEWRGPTDAQPLTNRGSAFRSTANSGGISSPVSTSDKTTSWVADGNGGYAVRYGNAGITAASNSNTAQRHHGVNMAIAKTGNTATTFPNTENLLATNRRYLRFTAWRDASNVAPATAFFMAGMASPPSGSANGGNNQFPDTAIGPWNSTGTAFQGFSLTTTKQVFTLDLWDETRFKADPVYRTNVRWLFANTQTSVTVDRKKIASLNLGYYRSGTNAGSAMDPVAFYVDDIILQRRPAGYDTTAAATLLPESGPGNSTQIGVALTSLPSHSVTIQAASLQIGAATLSPSSLTFTPANWETPQYFTVNAVDNGMPDHGDRSTTITFTKGSTADLLYANSSVSVPTDLVINIQNQATAAVVVTTSSLTLEEIGPSNTATVDVVLASIPTAPVSVAVQSSDTGAFTVSSSPLLFDNSNWNIPQTVTLTAVDDDITSGGNRSASLDLNLSTGCPFYGALPNPPSESVQIINNGLPVSLSHMSVE